MNVKSALLGAALVASVVSTQASASTTIDFTTLPLYTAVTTQFAGVTFSLEGGPVSGGAPVTGSFGTYGLGNSPTGDYPTSNVLDVAFSSGVSNLSFTFDNFGNNSSAPSYYYAYGTSGLISSGDISGLTYSYGLVTVAGSGINDLKISNGSGGNYNWEFGVGQVTYSAVPETSTWAMMLAGFAGLGFLGYRRNKAAVAA